MQHLHYRHPRIGNLCGSEAPGTTMAEYATCRACRRTLDRPYAAESVGGVEPSAVQRAEPHACSTRGGAHLPRSMHKAPGSARIPVKDQLAALSPASLTPAGENVEVGFLHVESPPFCDGVPGDDTSLAPSLAVSAPGAAVVPRPPLFKATRLIVGDTGIVRGEP